MDIANLPRYEMGRCVSCGDCNRDPAYVDEDGEWVKFSELEVALRSTIDNTGSPKLPPCACCEERASLGHYLEKGYNFCPFCGRQLRASA